MRLPVRVSMISSGGDLKVCGLLLVCTPTTVWPWMRAWTPLATVTTSGGRGLSSTIGVLLRLSWHVIACYIKMLDRVRREIAILWHQHDLVFSGLLLYT